MDSPSNPMPPPKMRKIDKNRGKEFEKQNVNIDEENFPSSSKAFNQQEEEEEPKMIPNWLIESLEWVKRGEMADSALSTSCWTFKQLCLPKLHGDTPRQVPWLSFWRGRDREGNFHGLLEREGRRIEIATLPSPDNIGGFKKITFYYLNDQILEFVQNIFPKFVNVELNFCTKIENWKPNAEERKVGPMNRLLTLLASKIGKLNFYFDCQKGLEHFQRLFPAILDQIEFICVNAEEKDFDILFEWLGSKGGNGGGKRMLRLRAGKREEQIAFVERIKENFSSNSGQNLFSNFVILLDFPIEQFTMENEGQILCLFLKLDEEFNFNRNYLAKFSAEEEQWKDEGVQKILKNPEKTTAIYLET